MGGLKMRGNGNSGSGHGTAAARADALLIDMCNEAIQCDHKSHAMTAADEDCPFAKTWPIVKRMHRLTDKIAKTPAASQAGVRAKISLLARYAGDQPMLALSVAADMGVLPPYIDPNDWASYANC